MSDFKDISKIPRIKRIKLITPSLSLEDTIKYCIKKGYKLDFLYEDEENKDVLSGFRSVSPAAIGNHVSTGNNVMRAFLNEGVSKSERDPKWRLFRLDRIKQYNIHYQKNRIGQNKLYRMNDKHISGSSITQIQKSFENLLLC